jgi:hypothetical protein
VTRDAFGKRRTRKERVRTRRNKRGLERSLTRGYLPVVRRTRGCESNVGFDFFTHEAPFIGMRNRSYSARSLTNGSRLRVRRHSSRATQPSRRDETNASRRESRKSARRKRAFSSLLVEPSCRLRDVFFGAHASLTSRYSAATSNTTTPMDPMAMFISACVLSAKRRSPHAGHRLVSPHCPRDPS